MRLIALLVVGLAACTTIAGAAEQPLVGRVALIKPGKIAKYISKPGPAAMPLPGGATDPRFVGAALQFADTGGSAGDTTFTLPPSGWTGLGNPAGSRGYKYRGARAFPVDSTCSVVLLTTHSVKAICKGPGVTLFPPFSGDAAIRLGIPAGTAGLYTGTAAAIRYCAEFGGETERNDFSRLLRKNAPPPANCESAGVATPTATGASGATPTRTPTGAGSGATSTPTSAAAASSTPTATATPPSGGNNSCPLASGSHLKINAQAFPLSLNMSGALKVNLGTAGAGGIAPVTCDVDHIDPINVTGVGVVCVSPASGCDVGVDDCDGGTALNVELRGNGNIGACASPSSGNSDCEAQCGTYCAGIGKNYLSSGCTGRCSASERVCTKDQECSDAGEGSCNGPDPVQSSQKDICQCQCLDLRVPPPGAAGELQCHLGANINLENAAPCGDGDVKVVVGRTCIPLTTATASTQILNANFSSSSLPSSPTSDTGAHLACAAQTANGPSGLQMRGVANFFGSSLGDLAVELFGNCQ